MKRYVAACVVLGALCSQAIADDSNDNYRKYDLPREAERIKTTPPAPGVDKAATTGPAWCAPLTDKPSTYGFGGHLESYYNSPATHGYELFGAAGALCHNDPKEPIIEKAATEIVQLWMNSTGLSEPDAVESIKMWLNKDGYEAEQKQLCGALALDEEVGGAERAFQEARRELFDCGGSSHISTMGAAPMQNLAPWLDSSAKEADEIVRLSYVLAESNAIAKASDDYRRKTLVNYAVASIDYKAFQPKAALALLDSAPYKGNTFARVNVKEAIGRTRLNVLGIEADVQKLVAKDPDWKSILIDAPQKGAADWMAAASKLKAELQRSAEFEQAAFGPSKKALAGCQEPLRKDLAGVLKSLKRDTAKQLIEQMNEHAVAGLLFRRYNACVAGAGDPGAAVEMRRIEGLRVLRGPRAAAYYATIDAIGKVRADRAKFPIEEHDVGVSREDILDKLVGALAHESKNPSPGAGDYHIWQEGGVVKTAAKGKDGIKVVFATDKQERYIETSCVETNHIVMFATDGRPIYYRKCKGSVQKVDVSPNPINIPVHLAEGVAPGKLLNFGVSNSQERRISMPFEIYADKKGHKLVTWYGIGL